MERLDRKRLIQIENGLFKWKTGRSNEKRFIHFKNGSFKPKMGRSL